MLRSIEGIRISSPTSPLWFNAFAAATGLAFHHATADYACRKFLAIAEKLARPKGKLVYGKDFENLIMDL